MDIIKHPKTAGIAVAVVMAIIIATGNTRGINTAVSRLYLIGMATGFGFGIGWFLSPLASTARRAILYVVGALILLVALGGRSGIGWSAATLLALVGFCIGIGHWLGKASRGFFQKPTTFGSAEWADEPYLREHDIIGDKGIRLGGFATKDGIVPLHYDGDRHLLTVAPTRAGKGTTLIIPNLLTYRGSTLVIDPKGENAMITADQRRAMGQDVHVVDPYGIASRAGSSSRFNPLDWLVMGDPDITENAMLLADALVVPSGKGDSFWDEEAKALLQGLILYVATDEAERDNRHLGRVRDLLLLDGDGLPELFQRMYGSMHHIVSSTGARCLQKDEKLLSNVLASAQAQTHFLDSARIRASLSASDFKFEDLKSTKTTIYLVLPADRLNTFGRWLRLLIQQAITVNARNIETRPDKSILFVLDEMPALGRLTMVEQAYSLMAGFGMQLWGIVQDCSQLKRIYGESWQGFVANSGCVTYAGSRDKESAEYFSALCGVTTVWNLSTAIASSFGSSGNNSNSSTSNTTTTAVVQRKLAYPDELMRLNSARALVLIDNLHPIQEVKQAWFTDDTLKNLGVNLHEIAQ